MTATLLHRTQILEVFGNIFAPPNSLGSRTVCIKIGELYNYNYDYGTFSAPPAEPEPLGRSPPKYKTLPETDSRNAKLQPNPFSSFGGDGPRTDRQIVNLIPPLP